MSQQSSSVWKQLLQNNEFRKQTAATVVLLSILLYSYGQFIINIERRQGVVLADPVLAMIPSFDVSWFVFFILYSSIFVTIYQLASRPLHILLGFQTFLLMYVFRTVAIYLAPFEPPIGYVPLQDPIISLLVPSDKTLSKDLFFSGHTAVMSLLFLFSHNYLLRIVLAIATLFLMIALAIQHVHYSVDIFIAPLITYTSYRLVISYQASNGVLKSMHFTELKETGLLL